MQKFKFINIQSVSFWLSQYQTNRPTAGPIAEASIILEQQFISLSTQYTNIERNYG